MMAMESRQCCAADKSCGTDHQTMRLHTSHGGNQQNTKTTLIDTSPIAHVVDHTCPQCVACEMPCLPCATPVRNAEWRTTTTNTYASNPRILGRVLRRPTVWQNTEASRLALLPDPLGSVYHIRRVHQVSVRLKHAAVPSPARDLSGVAFHQPP